MKLDLYGYKVLKWSGSVWKCDFERLNLDSRRLRQGIFFILPLYRDSFIWAAATFARASRRTLYFGRWCVAFSSLWLSIWKDRRGCWVTASYREDYNHGHAGPATSATSYKPTVKAIILMKLACLYQLTCRTKAGFGNDSGEISIFLSEIAKPWPAQEVWLAKLT